MFAIVFYFIWWIWIFLYLYSSGTWQEKGNGLPFGEMKWDEGIRNLILYHCFALLWNVNFILAFCSFVLSSSCCLWYFS